MSTNASVTVKTNAGNYTGIYIHWDGYAAGVGATLLKNYNTEEKILELMALGNLSSLGSKLNPSPDSPHTINKPQKDTCFSYGRDRHDAGEEAWTVSSTAAAKKYADRQFNYLFADGKWAVNGKSLPKTILTELRNSEANIGASEELTSRIKEISEVFKQECKAALKKVA